MRLLEAVGNVIGMFLATVFVFLVATLARRFFDLRQGVSFNLVEDGVLRIILKSSIARPAHIFPVPAFCNLDNRV